MTRLEISVAFYDFFHRSVEVLTMKKKKKVNTNRCNKHTHNPKQTQPRAIKTCCKHLFNVYMSSRLYIFSHSFDPTFLLKYVFFHLFFILYLVCHQADWPTCAGISRFNDPDPWRRTGHRKDISGSFIEAAAVPRS